ncbi:phytoene desaturase family protein [Microvirga guangxiensis]|uniref:Phytoene desaturase n=1 Tax=Microvirga guangxiensis TaxID=549386 RepID=A0A1G5EFI7_9HYPH|nr:phytoene desaturase family protein [Microvirga guangxiensis]SCY25742.1 phytoene desaturase [Microvirga guangxiensis]
MSNAAHSSRVAIVGAGPGGLASAMLLAREGIPVTIFESEPAVGGRTRTIHAPGGYKFDIGPTFFLYPRVLKDIFEACGERLEDHVELKRLDPQYHLVFEGGGEIRATGDLGRLEQEIARLAPADARNVRRFLDDNRAKLEAFRPVLEQSFSSPADLVSPAMLAALPKLRPFSNVNDDLKRYFADPRVRLAFSFQTKYLGMSPFQCPSLFTILSFLEYEHGVYHPIGGCGAVSEAMADVARKMGVDIRLNTPVDRILYDNGEAVGVEAGGERFAAGSIVVNGDFGHAMRRLVPEAMRPRWKNKRLDRAKLSCSTFMLYLGIEGDIGDLSHHTILLAKDYERNIREITEGILSEEPSVYVQHAGASDPSLAPKGHTSLYVLVPVPNLRCNIDWQKEGPRYRRLALERLKLLGLNDIESRIRFERVVTPRGWQDEFSVFEGATFNLAHNLTQMLYFRPHNRFGRNVYLVGGGTHPGSGLPVIYEGARITTRLLLEDRERRRSGEREAEPEVETIREATL